MAEECLHPTNQHVAELGGRLHDPHFKMRYPVSEIEKSVQNVTFPIQEALARVPAPAISIAAWATTWGKHSLLPGQQQHVFPMMMPRQLWIWQQGACSCHIHNCLGNNMMFPHSALHVPYVIKSNKITI